VIPSAEVITLFPVPLLLTAQKSPNSFAHVTDCHKLSAADVLLVQVIPSAEVITLFPVPLLLTAQNSPNSFAQVTDRHALSAADVLLVHGCRAQ
jgi:hypothetical protein